MDLEIKKLIPAVIEMNIEEVETFIKLAKEKYNGLVFTEAEITLAKEERAKLNKLSKNISDVRKKIEKDSKVEIEKIITTLKNAEKEITELSKNIDIQIKEFEENEWQIKLKEINEMKERIFLENKNIEMYFTINERWKNKTFKLSDIEAEISTQFEKLNKKYNFIISQLNTVNEEIENKIEFKNIEYLMLEDYDVIMKTLINEKNKIKETEENIKRKAQEEARKKLEQEQLENQQEEIEKEIKNDEIEENTNSIIKNLKKYILIQVSGLSKEATEDLLNVIKKHNIEYIKEVR